MIIAIARETIPAAAAFDRDIERLAQEKTTVVLAAVGIAQQPMSPSVERDPMLIRKDVAVRLREALPESLRPEFLTLLFGMVFVTVAGLLAIYFADRKDAQQNGHASTVWFARAPSPYRNAVFDAMRYSREAARNASECVRCG